MGKEIHIITGERGSGKSTFLKEVIAFLQNGGIRVGGILAIGSWKENLRDKFELIDLLTGDQLLFCQREPVHGWDQVSHFYINPAGQYFGEKALHVEHLKTADVIVIDEVGPFELQGKGWALSLGQILNQHHVPLVLIIRTNLIDQVIKFWNLTVSSQTEVTIARPDQLAGIILNQIR